MKNQKRFPIYSILILVIMLAAACQPGGGGASGDAASGDQALSGAARSEQQPAVNSAESDGFKAEATSSMSVLLSWTAVDGVSRYQIETAAAGDEYLPLAELGPDVTSAEVLPIPDRLEISYRLTAVLADGKSEVREVSLATPEETPNSYTVEVALEESQVVIPGFDPSTFDPATFDPSTFDASQLDPENFDLSSLVPGPATVSQEIGTEGGTIEVTSASGVVYSLTFPPDALPFTVTISLTPIASLGGLPQDVEVLGAVQIEPDGIPLDAPATLTITWPETISEDADNVLVGVGFENSGQDFHFLPLVSGTGGTAGGNSGSLKLADPVLQPAAYGAGGFSMFQTQSQGMAKASPRSVINQAKNNPPADKSRSTNQKAAVKDASSDSSKFANDDLAPLVPPFQDWLNNNIQDRAGSDSSRDLMEAITDFEIALEKFGDQLTDEQKEKTWDSILDSVYKKLKAAAEAPCLSDEHMYGIQLAERLSKPASPFSRELLKRFLDKYGAEGKDLIKKASELAERCPLYLWIDSNILYTALDSEVTVHTKMTADITLTWKFDRKSRQPYLIGQGPIEYEANDTMLGTCKAVPNTTQGSTFFVQKLSPVFTDQSLTDFRLERYKATGRMTYIIITIAPADSGCVEGPQPGFPRADQWWTDFGAYMLLHGFPVTDWVIRANAGMSTIADKTIEHNGGTIDLGELVGTTKFIILNENPQ